MGVKWGIFDRLPWWHRTQQERSKSLHPRSKEHGGRTQRLGSGQGPSWGRFRAPRHPHPQPQMSLGSGEVDVVVSPMACLLIEVKNFIGTISLQDGDIIQYKGSKPVMTQGNPSVDSASK